jgi:hypothetical protein
MRSRGSQGSGHGAARDGMRTGAAATRAQDGHLWPPVARSRPGARLPGGAGDAGGPRAGPRVRAGTRLRAGTAGPGRNAGPPLTSPAPGSAPAPSPVGGDRSVRASPGRREGVPPPGRAHRTRTRRSPHVRGLGRGSSPGAAPAWPTRRGRRRRGGHRHRIGPAVRCVAGGPRRGAGPSARRRPPPRSAGSGACRPRRSAPPAGPRRRCRSGRAPRGCGASGR